VRNKIYGVLGQLLHIIKCSDLAGEISKHSKLDAAMENQTSAVSVAKTKIRHHLRATDKFGPNHNESSTNSLHATEGRRTCIGKQYLHAKKEKDDLKHDRHGRDSCTNSLASWS
jgi:hypothetical protein